MEVLTREFLLYWCTGKGVHVDVRIFVEEAY